MGEVTVGAKVTGALKAFGLGTLIRLTLFFLGELALGGLGGGIGGKLPSGLTILAVMVEQEFNIFMRILLPSSIASASPNCMMVSIEVIISN